MPLPYDPTPLHESSRRSRAALVFALILGLLLGLLLLGSIGWWMLSRTSGQGLLNHLWSAATGRTLTIDVSQPTVVDRILLQHPAATEIYTMDKVVSGAKENPIFPNF